ncbi:hypothetical protein GLOTRDRAFT_120134 [Gloeophyllum trabeum ATCC 11539]|uniref:N-acetyltransferase ECO1 n=1 Tax=Gloeophyllum trabeum (strain ATCC 11539 / FP-39264 / Madison 617) TaxID=670483 RepID=S7QG23_GLOTA|nr:uncharacterized protein GLOTRDRAFT_120134 [Gloeophyllum trabeum ATCC 11539]EPQ58377.1 hypothetical protein GLOTRDRAFT_120134 [Gloeophyllum trabeum ATCC 11539]
MASRVKRTYGGARTAKLSPPAPSSPPSGLSSPPPASASSAAKRKRPLIERLGINADAVPPFKKRALSTKQREKQLKENKKTLTQLHFSLETSVLRTCSTCGLSYTKGAPDDESLHRAHCARVQRGMEWGREEEKERTKAGVEEVTSGVRLKDGRKGRIICVKADVGGKIGSKLKSLLETVNLSLSSPPLLPAALQASKVYLFLVPSAATSPTTTREKIVGCVIAQRISTAMAVVTHSDPSTPPTDPTSPNVPPHLITVDPTLGLFCDPTPLPTPLGIPRLFVSTSHRRQGIATHLLAAAARTFIHGCPLDPVKGEVAFTQPTSGGRAVMESWGRGGVRVYEE